MHDTKQHIDFSDFLRQASLAVGEVPNTTDARGSLCVICGGAVGGPVGDLSCAKCKVRYKVPPPSLNSIFPERRELMKKFKKLTLTVP